MYINLKQKIMITKDQLKLTWEEFLSVVETQEEKILKKREECRPQFRESKVLMRFPLSPKIVEPEYTSRLKELYHSNGWDDVRVGFTEKNDMGLTELIIELFL